MLIFKRALKYFSKKDSTYLIKPNNIFNQILALNKLYWDFTLVNIKNEYFSVMVTGYWSVQHVISCNISNLPKQCLSWLVCHTKWYQIVCFKFCIQQMIHDIGLHMLTKYS